MKRAALYARVSGDVQAKEGAIESQVLALKKQIAAAGHVLVREYIDNGFSGPCFDRPALDQMRKDLKTNVFDVIYFHTADRIARLRVGDPRSRTRDADGDDRGRLASG